MDSSALTRIQTTLSEMKKLEEAATEGPFVAYEKFPCSIAREFEILAPGGGVLMRSTSYSKMKEDTEFFAASRTNQPRLRKALEVAVDLLAIGNKVYDQQCLKRIADILTGEGEEGE